MIPWSLSPLVHGQVMARAKVPPPLHVKLSAQSSSSQACLRRLQRRLQIAATPASRGPSAVQRAGRARHDQSSVSQSVQLAAPGPVAAALRACLSIHIRGPKHSLRADSRRRQRRTTVRKPQLHSGVAVRCCSERGSCLDLVMTSTWLMRGAFCSLPLERHAQR